MNQATNELVCGFLITEQARFEEYISGCGLDDVEATVIIEEMLAEFDSLDQDCVEPFSGFIGE